MATAPAPSLTAIVTRLRNAGCVNAEEEARLLMAAAPNPTDLATMVERRATGAPLEHVVGWAMFCGRRMVVKPGVFVPRRSTEFLVHQTMALTRPGATVVELCCGCGAVSAALLAALRHIRVHAVDIDPVAVECAQRNIAVASGGHTAVAGGGHTAVAGGGDNAAGGYAAVGTGHTAVGGGYTAVGGGYTAVGSGHVAVGGGHAGAGRGYATSVGGAHGVLVGSGHTGPVGGGQVYTGDLYRPLPSALRGSVDIVVASPPYVPSQEIIFLPIEARDHEPLVALDGGADGLDVIRRICAAAPLWLTPGGHLLIEASDRQASRLAEIIAGNGLAPHVVASQELNATVVIGRMPQPR